jgi:cob(I)alamin adenosyltransferase
VALQYYPLHTISVPQRRYHLPEKLDHGLISIFTGDGKGKTTAAIGNVIRAAGHGLRVFIISFMKGKDYIQSENVILSQLPNVKIATFGQVGWIKKENINDTHKNQAISALATAKSAISNGEYDIIVLDEINVAIYYGLINIRDVLELIKEKPKQVDVILTGRHADPRLIQMADLVTDMKMVKHPYTKGIEARQGIDY